MTGGGGFLGSAVCRQLAMLGHHVVAFQRRPAPHLGRLGVQVRRGDVRDRQALTDAVDGCDAVIHAAARAGLWGDAGTYHEINVGGTRNVIESCRERGVGRLLHTSSPSVVLCGRDIEGGDESLPLVSEPLAPYPASKTEAERLVLIANGHGLRSAALRPQLMWGPGDPHLLPRLLQRARHDRLFLPAPGKKHDVVFVENAARAHVQALQELCSTGRCAGKAYFVTNNEPVVQGEFVLRLLKAVGVEARIRTISPAAARMAGAAMEAGWRLLRIRSEPPMTRFLAAQLSASHWFDGSAARRDFGYVAPISIDQGLALLARAHRAAAAGAEPSGRAAEADDPGQPHG